MDYLDFLRAKILVDTPSGFDVRTQQINSALFDFQRDIVKWALKRGRSAVFAECGLGKSLIQLEWAKHIHEYTGKNILILAPLAVSKQTVREGSKLNLKVTLCGSDNDIQEGINITNYEKLHKFNSDKFTGIVCDESSIMKSFSGKIRNELISRFRNIPYKLCCTATPSPNDYAELGNHAEFLGIMSRTEMLSMFFVHDGGDTSKWRLKGHAESEFWKWLCSWSVYIRKPSDLGYEDEKFLLPELKIHKNILTSTTKPKHGFFLPLATTLTERREARKDSLGVRVERIKELIAQKPNDTWLIWCNLNIEGNTLEKCIPDSVQIQGSDTNEFKEQNILNFSDGKIKTLITKPKIAGFGINWQACHNIIFAGISDSWESYYQAVRRCWRFGQEKTVNVYIVLSDREILVLDNIQRKGKDVEKMALNMVEHMKEISTQQVRQLKKEQLEYQPKIEMELPKWL